MSKVRTWFVVLAALAIVAAACGEDDTTSGASGGAIEPSKTYATIGEPEGALELIAWAGYVEDGTSEGGEDFDWVTPFEDATGCQVNVTYGDTSDEMVTLMRQGGGQYDMVSASGDASLRLIQGKNVQAMNPKTIGGPNCATTSSVTNAPANGAVAQIPARSPRHQNGTRPSASSNRRQRPVPLSSPKASASIRRGCSTVRVFASKTRS